MALNERENKIMDLINQLAAVADDETTTQATIDNIMASIKHNTQENIKSEMESAKNGIYKTPNMEFPSKDMSNEIYKMIMSESNKTANEITNSMNSENQDLHQQLIFTRMSWNLSFLHNRL